MEKKAIFIFGFLLVIIICSFVGVSALDTDYSFKINNEINLKRPCINNGTWCSGSAVCNITITSPNNTIILDNAKMTNSGAYHNISLTHTGTCNKDQTCGVYKADVICIDGSRTGSETFYYEITPTGYSLTTSQSLSGVAVILIVFLLGAILIIFGWNIFTNSNIWYFGVVVVTLGIGMFIYSVSLINIYSINFGYTTGTTNIGSGIVTTFFFLLKIAAWGLPMLLVVYIWASWRKRKDRSLSDGWDFNEY